LPCTLESIMRGNPCYYPLGRLKQCMYCLWLLHFYYTYRLKLLIFTINIIIYFNLAFIAYSQCVKILSYFCQYILNKHTCRSHICYNLWLPRPNESIFKILQKKRLDVTYDSSLNQMGFGRGHHKIPQVWEKNLKVEVRKYLKYLVNY
jgi:hypothetical protein